MTTEISTTKNYFLREGQYSGIDHAVIKVANKIRRSRNANKITEIQNFVSAFDHIVTNKRFDFRNRTASEIIKSGYSTGCTDDALVFCTLARALNIPSKYVETINKEWLKSPFGKIKIHVFVDVFLKNNWTEYDPQSSYCHYKKTSALNGAYIAYDSEYVEIGKGLDFGNVNVNMLNCSLALKRLEDILDVAVKMNLFNAEKTYKTENTSVIKL